MLKLYNAVLYPLYKYIIVFLLIINIETVAAISFHVLLIVGLNTSTITNRLNKNKKQYSAYFYQNAP